MKTDCIQFIFYILEHNTFLLWSVFCYFFIAVPWVGLPCLIVSFSDHTHLLFSKHFVIFIVEINSDCTHVLLYSRN